MPLAVVARDSLSKAVAQAVALAGVRPPHRQWCQLVAVAVIASSICLTDLTGLVVVAQQMLPHRCVA